MWCDPELIHYKSIDNVNEYNELVSSLINYNWTAQVRNTYIVDTKGIWIPFVGKGYNDFDFTQKYVTKDDISVIKLCVPLFKEISNLFPNHNFIKGEIYYLPGNTYQNLHVDPKVFHRFSHRVHIPIVTTGDSFLQIGENAYNLKPFNIYSFNNVVYHRSLNKSQDPRIHIVVDVINRDMHSMLLKKNVDIWGVDLTPGTSDVSDYFKKITA